MKGPGRSGDGYIARSKASQLPGNGDESLAHLLASVGDRGEGSQDDIFACYA